MIDRALDRIPQKILTASTHPVVACLVAGIVLGVAFILESEGKGFRGLGTIVGALWLWAVVCCWDWRA